MKRFLYPFLLVYALANGQDFKKLYRDKLKSSWEIYNTASFIKTIDPKMDSTYRKLKGKGYRETLIENQKRAVEKNALRLSEIIDFFNIELSDLESLALVEERSLGTSPPMDFTRKGAVITKDGIFGFKYYPEVEEQRVQAMDYFSNSGNPEEHKAKQIIRDLIIGGKTAYLDTISKAESDLFSGMLYQIGPEKEFEIILFKNDSEEKLKLIYLHETFVQIMNRVE